MPLSSVIGGLLLIFGAISLILCVPYSFALMLLHLKKQTSQKITSCLQMGCIFFWSYYIWAFPSAFAWIYLLHTSFFYCRILKLLGCL